MFSVEPFKIISYSPKIIAFGGVEYTAIGLDIRTVTDDVTNVVKSLGNSLRRAYEVKTAVYKPKESFLSTKISPVKAKLDKK